MPETNDKLGECECFADVIRRQGLRYEAEGRKARTSLAALPGIKNEQNVRRWGPVVNGIGGEHPNLGMVLEHFRHWPRAMQLDVLVVLLSGSRLTVSVSSEAAAGDGSVNDLMGEALKLNRHAGRRLDATYDATSDGQISGGESSNLVELIEEEKRLLTQFGMKVLNASTTRPLRGHGGR